MSDQEEKPTSVERDPEERLTSLERDLKTIAGVASATADDTLRVCLVLQEMAEAGFLPELPWGLASTIVDLRYAQMAAMDEADLDGSLASRIAELEGRIEALREEFRKRAYEQQAG